MTLSDPSAAVAVELAGLRTQFDRFGTDLGEVRTAVAVLVERSTRTDADVRQLRADMEKELDELRTEVNELKARRFPLPVVGALLTAGGLVVALVALFVQ